MNKDSDSDKIFKSIRDYSPSSENRDSIIERVISETYRESIKERPEIINKIFWWAEYPVLRRVLVSLSLLIVIIFAGQQLLIVNRISKLESRIVESNTQQLLEHQGRNVLMKSAIMTSGEQSMDSIKVSDSDLRSLIDSYIKLQKQYDELEDLYREKIKTGL